MTPARAATELSISLADARMWLARLEREGVVVRTGGKRPTFTARQTSLFAGTAPDRPQALAESRALADGIHDAFRFLTFELAYDRVGPTEVAAQLGVSKRYAGRGLRRLVKEGSLQTVELPAHGSPWE